jgi:putative endonuclease
MNIKLADPAQFICMRSYYVYILLCGDGSYYTGVTNNLERRLYEHETGFYPPCYTATRQPVILKYHQQFHDIWQTIAFEKQVKGWSRRKKEALIKEEWERLRLLSRNYTEHGKIDEPN